MRNFDLHEQFEAVKASAINSIRSIFPIQGKLRTLKIDEIWVEDSHGMKDYADQLAVKNKEGTWGVPVYANMSLVDRSSGKILDREKKVKIFNLPKVTDRLSYIVKGNEYQVTNQFRLKPGVYTLRKQNGELKTQINLSKGKNFDIVFDENKGLFTIQKIGGGQANIPLYPLLVHLGMSAQAMVGAWGAKIEAANRLTDPKIVARTATAFGVRKGTIKEYLASTEISKETTKVTLGQEFDRVDGPMLLASSKALLETHLGKKEPVDRDSLAFKELWSVEDFIHERIEKNKTTLEFKLGRNIDNLKRTKISQIVNPAAFSGLVETFFTQDDKSSTPEQTNPVEMIAGQYRATVMGSGGIKSDHAITNVMREIHPSHYGFVDPIHSPEGNVGVNLNLPLGIVKDGKDIKMTVTDSRTNQKVFLKPTEAFDKVIAFPNQSGAKVKALHKGKFIEVAKDKVDYFTPNPMALFAPSTNLVPYLPTDQGNRAMMASKMMEQAISLKHREAPLVQVGISSNQTMEGVMGNIIAVKATEDGIIKKVTPDYLTLQNKDGEIKKINLYNNYPLNRKSFLTHNSTVKVGDKVKQGQLLAESNFTKDGVLALGTNLRTAYLPYKGRNFDDGIVITESAAEKLTSEHIHKKTYEVDDNSVLDLVGFKTNYPNILSMENSGNLDSRGIIKKGAKVKNGDVLIAALKRRPASASLNLVSKKLSNRPKDDSLTWTMEDDGTVMDVVKTPRSVTVMIKTEERAKIGDKLAGRHGNKGVITHIIPDSHAPHDKEGNPVDMLLNPTGVISRINIGQIYESAAGKAALKNKEVYNVSNFTGEDYLKTTKEYLKKSGVDDKEELFDPHTKKSLGQIHVGNPHILKLFKQSTANYSVRQGGPGNPYDANMQPTKGGEEGSKAQDLLTLYSMLSHGARANLREMSSIKSTSNDEYWKALKSGQQLPPPKPSFAYEKFMSYLKGSGIDVKKNGSKLTLAPLTDKQLSEMSNGEITKPVFFRGKDNQPMKGGFFDPVIMGGFNGEKWGHIALHEPVVNPVFEKAARSVVGIGKKFDELLAGTLHINPKGEFNTEGKGVSGGAAIAKLLSAVDVEKEIDSQMTRTKRATGPQLDEANKRLRYLMALKENGLSPTEAYIRKNIPVLPTTYRPIYPRPDGSLISSNTNYIYQNIGILNNMMDAKKMPVIDLLPEEDKAALRSDLYNHIKGLSGLTDITIKGKPRDGFIAEIKGGTGGQPKEGFFISKLLSKKQDFVGRGTIIPEPDLHVDEMGMPEEMAWKLFEPFVIREMKNHGKSPLQAKDEINNKTPLAKKALELVMADRHVLLNRAPSLHKFSIMAFRPKITEGRSIKVQPLVNTGFNADHDGDQQLTSTLTFVSRLGISHLIEKYGLNFVEARIMTARYHDKIPTITSDGEILVFNLEDFPHADLLGKTDTPKGLIEFYRAMPGFQVLAYNHDNHQIEWQEVYGWSKHLQREIEIVTLSSGKQIFTDDDPRAVYGIAHGNFELTRNTPTDALKAKMLVPRVANPMYHFSEESSINEAYDLKLTADLGYITGCMASNGWVEHCHNEFTGKVFIATLREDVGSKFMHLSKEVFAYTGMDLEYFREFDQGGMGQSKKWGFTSQKASTIFMDFVGKGARNKHLPPFFLSAPRCFREGLFAGLMDNDGSISINNSRSKPQLLANYSTTSVRLAQEFQWLASSLSIFVSISTSKTPLGEPCYTCNVSSIDLKKWNCKEMVHLDKLAVFNSCEVNELSTSSVSQDIVPITPALAKAIYLAIGAPRTASKERKTAYAIYNKSFKSGFITRFSAKKVFELLPLDVCKALPDWDAWQEIVNNKEVTWDKVQNVERTGILEDGYDLTVPGYETFCNVDGVILSNTMTVHLPISDEANREAAKMLPSRNLFQPGTGKLMIIPSQEAQIGLFYMSGTTKGRATLNKLLPKSHQITSTLDKKVTQDFLRKIAKDLPSNDFGNIVTMLKMEGEKHSYEGGFTLGLNDLAQLDHHKDTLIKNMEHHLLGAKTEGERAAIGKNYTGKLDQLISNKLKGKHNPLFDMIESGAKGSISQLRSIVATPLLVTDAKGRTIYKPIKKSYTEGLDMGDYWVSMYGARRGMIDRSLQSSEPGAFSKDIMATTLDNVISGEDCGTKEGITFRLENTDAVDRFMAGNQGGFAHNTLVDSSVISRLKKAGIQSVKVRSPLKCLRPKGTCAKCYGLDENGHPPEIGDNIGAKAGQTIAEPLMQLTMNSFHTGGTVGSGLSGYPRIKQLLLLPKIVTGAATLSPLDGKIKKIEKGVAGGFNVTIGDKDSSHTAYVSKDLDLKVKLGQAISAGDPLSTGVIKPQDLVKHKGMYAAQEYITDELQKAYQSQGIGRSRKIFETIVRSLGNTTKVLNNPKGTGHVPGDIIPYTVAQHHNQNLETDVAIDESVGHKLSKSFEGLKSGHEITREDMLLLKAKGQATAPIKNDPIVHAPLLKGLSTLPMLRRDWMSGLGYRYLAKTLVEGAGQGWSTDLEDYHPIPAFAHGATFGQGKDGKY